MRKLILFAVVVAALLPVRPSARQDAVQAAAKALGTDAIHSLQISGAGSNFTVGQPYIGGGAWPEVRVKSYTARINYDTGSMRVDLVREMLSPIPRGGGVAFAGEQTQNFFYSGTYAWNGLPPAPPLPAPPPAAGAAPAPPAGRGAEPAVPAGPAPQPEAVVIERRLALLSTPHGFLRAARAGSATMRAVAGGTEVTVAVDGTYRLVGTISAANEVTRVDTWIPNAVMGDMRVETEYRDYRDFGGVKYPSRIVQRQGGQLALDITIGGVHANAVVSIIVPASVYMASTTPAPITVLSQQVAPGVFYLTGGSHHSVAIQQRDHIVIVDLPQSVERGEAVLAKAKELIPNTPVRFVVNTHVHFDHSGGLRAAVAEGATIVTHQTNRAFYASALAAPRTLRPDRAAANPVLVQSIGARGTLTDGARTIELHQIGDNPHSVGFLLVYLPAEKILIEADAYSPAAANAPPPTAPNLNVQALADTVTRLKLDVSQILAMHGPRVATMADLSSVAAVGR